MNKLEEYIKSQDNFIYLNKINHTDYNYDSYDDLELDLYFLIETLYPNYKIYNNRQERLDQETFRKDLIKHYGKCVITGSTCIRELEAAHIIPFSEDNMNNSVYNGLLLKSNIHKTFDDYYWTINPDSLCIEIKPNINVGEIMSYNKMKVNIDNKLIPNLIVRYNEFSTKKFE